MNIKDLKQVICGLPEDTLISVKGTGNAYSLVDSVNYRPASASEDFGKESHALIMFTPEIQQQ